VNTINPKKLYLSKWTAVRPINKEKHFLVSKITFDEEGCVEECVIEAVMTKRADAIDWNSLKDSTQWLQGWL
jgi:tryptophan-rich hypothetical protein